MNNLLFGPTLQSFGVILGLGGAVWFLWDKRATEPGYLIWTGLTCLVIGAILT